MFSPYGIEQKCAWLAASVAARRRAQAGQGMRASRSDTRAASQTFERMHMHVSMRREHILTDGTRSQKSKFEIIRKRVRNLKGLALPQSP
jgi:hypothetical protein